MSNLPFTTQPVETLGPLGQGTNVTFPHRPGYTRADRADDLQPAPVNIPARPGTSADPITRAHETITNTAELMEKYIAGIDVGRYSADGLRDTIRAFADTDAARAVDQAVDQAHAHQQNTEAQLRQVRADLSPDGDTAAELRATRYWARTQRLLDNTDNSQLGLTARELIDTANRAELGTLLQEIEPYLNSRGQSTGWVEPYLAHAIPEYGEAAARARLADKQLTVVQSNANQMKTRMATLVHPGQYRSIKFVDPAVVTDRPYVNQLNR
ncbi:MAG: hypothetical protein CME34_18810 [Gordonia sp.]|uniref:hypothetical protein n=1 Tax=Gordonia sp. (in: high G+C Gram-positive bacteria) TaxID=84139 RepID=UPI000C3D7B76|nr:hypothetical protein [Gordonia sp. (in: high G+C Gram-positive bacteria)]MAU83878.1 hypothetical protein [Gordonia sp. (in: high G+C Gram-positive bacteria)]